VVIWDTAGSERFRSLTPNFYRGAHGVFLVYDVSSSQSFENLQIWLDELEAYSTRKNMVKMLVANKCDKEHRQVKKEQGMEWAKSHSTLFIEASAKTREGVRTAFEELIAKILETPGLWEENKQRRSNLNLALPSENKGCCLYSSFF
jgi:ras-related protein rab-18A